MNPSLLQLVRALACDAWRKHWHNLPIGVVLALGVAAGWWAVTTAGWTR